VLVGTWVRFTLGWFAIAAVVASMAYLAGATTGEAAFHAERTVVGYFGTASQEATVQYVTFTNYRTCADGWQSPSIGKQGACSWHGGVVTRQLEEPHTATATCHELVRADTESAVREELEPLTTARDDWSCRGLPEEAEIRAVQGRGEVTHEVTEDYAVESVKDPFELDNDRGQRFAAWALIGVAVLGALTARSAWEDAKLFHDAKLFRDHEDDGEG
jgi:hypothetical protein